MNDTPPCRSIALIGNHPPRQCGIATFTSDLAAALDDVTGAPSWVVAMNDRVEGYRYPERVRFEIGDEHREEYPQAARFLTLSQCDVVCLQHEYGIFGGPQGEHLLDLLGNLRVPLVSTLHTVLSHPSPEQRKVLQEIARLSDKVVVMAERARSFLEEVYDVPSSKIAHVPHGIPDLPFVDPDYYKDHFGVEGRKMLLTFGLLSPGKGIEHCIRALPEIVTRHPEVVYVVLGATHPHVLRDHGEAYRASLQSLVAELGLRDHVIFHDRFVELDVLCEYLGAADIYVTPYLGESQIVSGTLAYALGAGKAVVSTPYWYAQEMLADGRGRLVPFRDVSAIAREVNHLLDHPVETTAMRKRAYSYCRGMVWREVGAAYQRLFEEAKQIRLWRPSVAAIAATRSRAEAVPKLRFDHMLALTDDTGMLQHARYAAPNRAHGYCTDDNARALVAALGARHVGSDERVERAGRTYLSFLEHAFNDESGRFRNFMSFDRRWLEDAGSMDSHGRAVWALGVLVAEGRRDWEQALGLTLLKKAMPALTDMHAPRPQAFAMLGLHAYLSRFGGDREARVAYDTLANALHLRFLLHGSPQWPWPEEQVTYDNARLPQALLQAARLLRRDDMGAIALSSLAWLVNAQTRPPHGPDRRGIFAPVGNRGWWTRGGPMARYDQQPLEAGGTVEACLLAWSSTLEATWLHRARLAFNWFLGNNDAGAALVDAASGGCRDGLGPQGPNENQGAESTLSWVLARLAMQPHLDLDQQPRRVDEAASTEPSIPVGTIV